MFDVIRPEKRTRKAPKWTPKRDLGLIPDISRRDTTSNEQTCLKAGMHNMPETSTNGNLAGTRSRIRWRFLAQLLFQWAGLVLLWLIFVFQVTTSELLVGAAASALTVVALRAALRAVPLCFQPKLRWLAQIGRLPAMIAQDLWILLKKFGQLILRKRSGSRLELVDFPATGDDAHACAQRALAVFLVSMSPNSIVLHIDRKTGSMMMHQLKPQPAPALLDELLERT
jgi:multisubunit Na+/H+ antiporter MnhE subunit